MTDRADIQAFLDWMCAIPDGPQDIDALYTDAKARFPWMVEVTFPVSAGDAEQMEPPE